MGGEPQKEQKKKNTQQPTNSAPACGFLLGVSLIFAGKIQLKHLSTFSGQNSNSSRSFFNNKNKSPFPRENEVQKKRRHKYLERSVHNGFLFCVSQTCVLWMQYFNTVGRFLLVEESQFHKMTRFTLIPQILTEGMNHVLSPLKFLKSSLSEYLEKKCFFLWQLTLFLECFIYLWTELT